MYLKLTSSKYFQSNGFSEWTVPNTVAIENFQALDCSRPVRRTNKAVPFDKQ